MTTAPPTAPDRARAPGAAVTTYVLGGLSALLLALVAARWSPLLSLDESVARPVHRAAVEHSGLTRVSRVLSDWVWDPWTMRIIAALLVLWLLRTGARELAWWCAGVCVFGTVLQQLLKAAVSRERPVWPDPVDSAHFASYPSGHALTATVVCGLVLWLLRLYEAGAVLWWTALAVAAVSVAGVGLTRVWLGVHWPSDVVGGWLLGALLVLMAGRVRGRRATGA
ncbi:phosphatase PAP2 family protein [Streptomyces sp. NPDC007088]|uniref:phosphatase PAP2 family protein n=1 Tax=Streptomyces sp. NPDC007088 TaxID=3364773 RepID=UPI0036957A48